MNLDKILCGMYEESCRLHNENRDAEAIFTCEHTATQALNTLGLAYCSYLGNYEKAIAVFHSALAIDPGNWLLWSNICHVRSNQGKHEEAVEAAFKAIKYSGGSVFDPFYNAGVSFTACGKMKEAIDMYRSALELCPDSPQSNYNLALCLLRSGYFQEGWTRYEGRFLTNELTGNFKKRFVQDHWDGRKFKNKTLLVYSEQGLGDFILFARFLPMVKKLGGEVICEVQEPLLPIVGKNLKVNKLISRPNTNSWPEPPVSDYCISISSLPRVLKIDSLDKVPTEPYIFAPKRTKPKFMSNDKLNIGICWCGNSDHQRDYTRSMGLGQFRPLASDGRELFGLLKGVSGRRNWPQGFVDLNEGIETFPMTNLADKIADFGDLAHFVNHLDLVITVDTGLAHLAGAMGKKVWVLLGKETDWRWGDDTTVSPWYPSMRLFRRKDTWENLIQEVIRELPS
jgi:tetratricopeptide (TPR) repeat protein